MSDAQGSDPQREIDRLNAELARAERESDQLKDELARTKEVQESLWSHEIYLKARRKMTGGVLAVLGILSALGLFTVYDMYKAISNDLYEKISRVAEGEIRESIQGRIKINLDSMFIDAQESLNARVKEKIDTLIDQKKSEVDDKVTELIKESTRKLEDSIKTAEQNVESLIGRTEEDVKTSLAALGKTTEEAQEQAMAMSERAREILSAINPPEEVTPTITALSQGSVDCDPNDLDVSQIERIRIKQLSEKTGQTSSGRKAFTNTFFVDVRGGDRRTTSYVDEACILEGIDRVIYLADPKWYRPSKFVRIDRENKFRFEIGGWGPTPLTAEVYLIGKRDPIRYQGTISTSDDVDELYLGESPPAGPF